MTNPTSSESSRVYLHLRAIFGRPADRSRDAQRRTRSSVDQTVPYGHGRDPRNVSEVINTLTREMGWSSPLARAELVESWHELVGVDVASHSTPAGVEQGTLTVRCDSTAWATQLRLMQSTIVASITERFPHAEISGVRFVGPHAPTWKHGGRSVPGQGPRDTYG